jgi:hypothetical protein
LAWVVDSVVVCISGGNYSGKRTVSLTLSDII